MSCVLFKKIHIDLIKKYILALFSLALFILDSCIQNFRVIIIVNFRTITLLFKQIIITPQSKKIEPNKNCIIMSKMKFYPYSKIYYYIKQERE